MIISIAGIAIVALALYIWMTRGFFSALLNLVCTVIAGAIAFALWESIAFALLDSGQDFLRDSAWGLGLALPFAVSLAVLRVAVDAILRANTKVDAATDYAGGAVLGAMAGMIVAGVVVNSMGYMRLNPGFFDAQPIRQTPAGIAREGGPFFPVDRWVGQFYGYTANAAFHTDTPLSKYYPRLDEVPAGLRMTDGDGSARNTMRLQDYELINYYTLKGSLETILSDKWRAKDGSGSQKYRDLDGNAPKADWVLHGVTLKFSSSAFESFGQFVTGNGPIRLLAEVNGEIEAYHPTAVATKSEAIEERSKKPKFGRFAFDTNGFSVASKGGDTDVTMSFEFVLPPGAKPYCIYVRNQRRDLTMPAHVYASAMARDSDIESGAIQGKKLGTIGDTIGDITDIDMSNLIPVKYAPKGTTPTVPPPGMGSNDRLPFVLMEGSTPGLKVDTESGNLIVEGEGKFSTEEVEKLQRQGLPKQLRVERFQTTEDVALVQVDMGKDMQINLTLAAFQNASQKTDGPMLIDKNGARYKAIGFIYGDKQLKHIRYTPGRPIEGMEELPSISTSRRDQTIVLIFRVTRNAPIQYMTVGKVGVAEYVPVFPFKK